MNQDTATPVIKVLIVDDDPLSLTLVDTLVKRWGFKTVTANNGADALQMCLSDSDIGIAILDWVMPGMEGPELCKCIREQIISRYVYCVMLTAHTDSGDLIRGFEMGADDFLTKPINQAKLHARLVVAERVVAMQRSLLREHALLTSSELELKKLVAENRTILASIPSFFITLDRNDHITTWNSAAASIFGKSEQVVLQESFLGLGFSWNWYAVLSAFAEAREKNKTVVLSDLMLRSKSGDVRCLELSVSPIVAEGKNLGGIILIGGDRTEKQRLLQQLGHAQKMESIGQLASGIAHELNSPMQFIGENVRFLQGAFSNLAPLITAGRKVTALTTTEASEVDYFAEEIPTAIRQTLEGVDRIVSILNAMKTFAHPGTKARVPTNLHQAIMSATQVCRHVWKSVAELKTEFEENLPSISVYPAELNQVFLNLIVNAAHAIQDRRLKEKSTSLGQITITTSHARGYVDIAVTDTGSGIPPEIRNRIFDPFFTTKEVGRGTGQGLSICYDVVTNLHHGTISFDSVYGQGATFKIRLPIQAEDRDGPGTEALKNHIN